MPDQKKNDEVDLFEFLLRVVNIFRKNFWLIVVFFLLGSALGVGFFFSSKKVFENKMIISSDILTESSAKTLFENANRYLREANSKVLAAQFQISEMAARQIGSLKIEALTKAESEDQKESERLLITVEVYDQQILPELQQGLIRYLENNDFAKIRVEQKKTYFKQMLSSVEKEIKDMENFKTRIFSGDFFQSNKGNIMFDPTVVNSKILELTEKKIGYQNGLEIVNSVQVIDGFTKFERPIRPKLSLTIASGSFVGLIFVGLLIAFKFIRELLRIAETAK